MTTAIMVMMPGASLMEITTVPGGLNVRCPGCGESLVICDSEVEKGGNMSLAHEDDCPVYARINDAI